METKHFNLSKDNGVATLCFDMQNEKVNKLSFDVFKELQKLLEEIKYDRSIKVLFITSAKKNIFIAGADISEIKQMDDMDDIYNKLVSIDAVLNELEQLPYPTVSVINGACMGGGLEFALCCNYRIATNSPKTKIAFPEVKLGIFPGFGGTQRAPKLIGLINSLDLILTGKTIDAKKAYRIGLVDKYFMEGHIEFKVKEFADSIINKTIKPRKMPFKYMEYFGFTREIIFKKAKENLVKKVHPSFKGPFAALELIHESFENSLKEGIEKEARAFSSLAITPESKNLIDLFFISEEIKKDFKNVDIDKKINRTAVVGNGVMGKGIIWLFSKYTLDVRIKLRKMEQVESIINATSKLYSFFVKTRKMTKKQVEFKINKLSYTNQFNGLSLTDFAIKNDYKRVYLGSQKQAIDFYLKFSGVPG